MISARGGLFLRVAHPTNMPVPNAHVCDRCDPLRRLTSCGNSALSLVVSSLRLPLFAPLLCTPCPSAPQYAPPQVVAQSVSF
mmetsp:Transcript_14783/g.34664  ORF Transcript_14783/g.34664 Transcript_14783/m.34664 type:complete len:82 (-) Transcript_14783:57-302(-)